MSATAIYAWGISPEFLAPAMLPNAAVIEWRSEHSLNDIVRLIDNGVGTLLFQTNVSLSSRMPLGRLELARECNARGIRTINAGITDITRRSLQSACRRLGLPSCAASANGDPDEMLIVKTNWNSGGIPESWLSDQDRRMLQIGRPPTHDYSVQPRSTIAVETWRHEELVVERFIDNSRGLFYRIFVAGEHTVVSEAFSDAPIKKLRTGRRRRNIFLDGSAGAVSAAKHAGVSSSVVEAARRFVNGVRLEFGTLDIMLDSGGEPYIVDVNATPYWGPKTQWELRDGSCFGGVLAHLRRGLGLDESLEPLARGPVADVWSRRA